jgi:hypothetical protein
MVWRLGGGRFPAPVPFKNVFHGHSPEEGHGQEQDYFDDVPQ